MSIASESAALLRRDLTTLIQQIEAFATDEMLWKTVPGVTNAAGNLILHIEGNLREYVGRQLGHIAFTRDRSSEFAAASFSRADLTRRIADLIQTIGPVIEGLRSDQMEAIYPQVVLERPVTTAAFLIHLYGHLNWHLGQIDYLRRTLSGAGAVPRVAL